MFFLLVNSLYFEWIQISDFDSIPLSLSLFIFPLVPTTYTIYLLMSTVPDIPGPTFAALAFCHVLNVQEVLSIWYNELLYNNGQDNLDTSIKLLCTWKAVETENFKDKNFPDIYVICTVCQRHKYIYDFYVIICNGNKIKHPWRYLGSLSSLQVMWCHLNF